MRSAGETESASLHLAYLGQGRDYHVQKWLPALAEQGLKVTLISYTPPDADLPGVDFRQLDPPFASSWKELSIRDFWGSANPLRAILNDIGPDVLMASYATNYGWLGVRTGFHPLIAQTWTADISIYPWTGWKRWIFRPMVRRVLREADLVTTDGEALAVELRRRFPDVADNVVPVRWGIRLRDYKFSDERRARRRAELGIPLDAPVLTSARGVLHIFRPAEVLKALLTTLEARQDLHAIYLTLARDRPPEVQSLLDQLDAHPRGHVFDRFLSKAEMQEVWSATDVLISVPTHDGVSEGILEGMYAGCIPIVSDIPSNRSFLKDGESGIFISGSPDSAKDLAETFGSTISALPNLKAELVDRNREWVAEHASVDATAAKVADMVENLESAQATR